MTSNILIAGSGNIGSRHLEGLTKVKIPINITIYDINKKVFRSSKKLIKNLIKEKYIKNIFFTDNIKDLGSYYDIAIIATNSKCRKKVINELYYKTNIKNIIIEKVAFQNLVDFKYILNLFKKNDSNSWVNCPRRMLFLYKNIKKKMIKQKNITIIIDGCNWGMACNAIHFIDLLSFITGKKNISINTSKLEKKIYKSKRKGFIEINGQMIIKSEGHKLILNENLLKNKTPIITIKNKNYFYEIHENNNHYYFANKKNNWKRKKYKYRHYFQSELTNILVEQIIKNKKCDLIDFVNSSILHKKLIQSLNKFLNNVTGKKYINCPIT